MKFSKYMLAMAASMAATVAFADEVDASVDYHSVTVVFATEADRYADGTPVKDGEWYALCWSANEKFGGLNLDCTPAVDGDLVITKMACAENGHCPRVFFGGSNAPSGGKYYVYLLDTRTPDRTSLSGSTLINGVETPCVVNGVSEAVKSSVYVVGETWAESSANNVEPFSQAKISEIKVDETSGLVDLTVVGMMPNVQYNVQMGQKIENVDGVASQKTYAVKIPKTGADKDDSGKVYFRIPKEDARFFKVVRQPLDLPVEAE